MLEISELDVSYGGVAAVRQVSIEVGKGEIVGLIGPNGAGKSTTLHAVMGLVSARSGEIRLAGESLLGRAPEAVACAGVSLVPEGRRIFAELTVEENLRLGLSGRRSREGAGEAVESVYALFPVVKEFRRRRAGVLSGGQQQQLAIARALVAGPDVLCSTSPRSASRPRSSTVFETLGEIRRRASRSCSGAARAAHRGVRRPYLPHGQRRDPLTMTPADADDTDTMVAAYLRERTRRTVLATINAQVVVDAIGLRGRTHSWRSASGLFGVLRLVNFAYGQLIMAGASRSRTRRPGLSAGASPPASSSSSRCPRHGANGLPPAA
jgi:branched-chain amino acid transport system ATP-binding protein